MGFYRHYVGICRGNVKRNGNVCILQSYNLGLPGLWRINSKNMENEMNATI